MRRVDTAELRAAARVLAQGGVVAHASEGVWGLACDPMNAAAVDAVIAVKGRGADKGLILIGADAESFAPELAALPEGTAAKIRDSWPGAVTWIVPNLRFGQRITGGRDSVAVRVPDHAQARALARRFGAPLVSTSANRTGEPPCLTADAVRETLGGEVDYVLEGRTGGRTGPSSIFDARTGEALR